MSGHAQSFWIGESFTTTDCDQGTPGKELRGGGAVEMDL